CVYEYRYPDAPGQGRATVQNGDASRRDAPDPTLDRLGDGGRHAASQRAQEPPDRGASSEVRDRLELTGTRIGVEQVRHVRVADEREERLAPPVFPDGRRGRLDGVAVEQHERTQR